MIFLSLSFLTLIGQVNVYPFKLLFVLSICYNKLDWKGDKRWQD
jgi:hypothetical protein